MNPEKIRGKLLAGGRCCDNSDNIATGRESVEEAGAKRSLVWCLRTGSRWRAATIVAASSGVFAHTYGDARLRTAVRKRISPSSTRSIAFVEGRTES